MTCNNTLLLVQMITGLNNNYYNTFVFASILDLSFLLLIELVIKFLHLVPNSSYISTANKSFICLCIYVLQINITCLVFFHLQVYIFQTGPADNRCHHSDFLPQTYSQRLRLELFRHAPSLHHSSGDEKVKKQNFFCL